MAIPESELVMKAWNRFGQRPEDPRWQMTQSLMERRWRRLGEQEEEAAVPAPEAKLK